MGAIQYQNWGLNGSKVTLNNTHLYSSNDSKIKTSDSRTNWLSDYLANGRSCDERIKVMVRIGLGQG